MCATYDGAGGGILLLHAVLVSDEADAMFWSVMTAGNTTFAD